MNILNIDYDKILREAYEKHGTLIVCFDFDNTVYDYHKTGLDCTPITDLLKRCDKLGFKLICNSSETNERLLNFKSVFLENLGLRVNGVMGGDLNKADGAVFSTILNPPTNRYVKPYANIYLDDKGGLKETYNRLLTLVKTIEKA